MIIKLKYGAENQGFKVNSRTIVISDGKYLAETSSLGKYMMENYPSYVTDIQDVVLLNEAPIDDALVVEDKEGWLDVIASPDANERMLELLKKEVEEEIEEKINNDKLNISTIEDDNITPIGASLSDDEVTNEYTVGVDTADGSDVSTYVLVEKIDLSLKPITDFKGPKSKINLKEYASTLDITLDSSDTLKNMYTSLLELIEVSNRFTIK